MPRLDLLVKADDQASGRLKEIQGRLRSAGKSGEQFGKQVSKGSKQADRALKNTKKAADRAKASSSSLARTAGDLKTKLLGILAAVGVVAFFRQVAAAALEEERAIARLNTTLKLTGEFTEEASKEIVEWSKTLQIATLTSKEQVLQGFALARSFVNTKEEAQELTAAALDFGVAADIAFTEAVRRLGRGVRGSTDDIAKFAPAIKDLTKDQLAAGEATRIIAERFRGTAADLPPFTKAVDDFRDSAGDLTQAVGGELAPSFIFWAKAMTFASRVLEGLFAVQEEGATVDEIALQMLTKQREAILERIRVNKRFAGSVRDGTRVTKEQIAVGAEEVRRLTDLINKTKERVEAAKKSAEQEKESLRLAKEREAADKRAAEAAAIAAQTAEEKVGKEEDALRKLLEIENELEAEALERAGRTTEAEERRRLDRLAAELETLDQLREAAGLSAEQVRGVFDLMEQAVNEDLESIRKKSSDDFTAVKEVGKQAAFELGDRFSTAAADIIVEGKSFEEAFKNIFKNILKNAIQTFIKIKTEAAITRAIAGGAAGGPAGFLAGFFGFQAGTQRVPGPVGQPRIAVVEGGERITPVGGVPPAGPGGGAISNITMNLQVADLGPAERARVLEALTEEIRAATDAGRAFASETTLATERNEGRSS